MKLVALYAQPNNEEVFMKSYFESHIPLIKKVPGLLDVKVIRLNRVLVGHRAPYMITEMTFSDKDSLKEGLNSEEMKAAGDNLDGFAKGLYTLCMAEQHL